MVECNYELNSKGSFEVKDLDHALFPDILPVDVELLINSLQRSIPFELFDPSGTTISHMVS